MRCAQESVEVPPGAADGPRQTQVLHALRHLLSRGSYAACVAHPTESGVSPFTLGWTFARWQQQHHLDNAGMAEFLQVTPATLEALASREIPTMNADVERLCREFQIDFERLVDVLWDAAMHPAAPPSAHPALHPSSAPAVQPQTGHPACVHR